MIAEYQVDKLSQRLSQQIKDIGYHSFRNMKGSSYIFKYDGKWYKLSIKVEEVKVDRYNDRVKSQI